MELYVEEFHKIMKKRHGYLFLLGMVLIKLWFGFFIAGDSHDTDIFIEENKEAFLQYEKEFGGKLTKKNQKRIRSLVREQNRTNEYLLELGRLMTEGNITMKEYREGSVKEREILQERDVIHVLNEQYQYAMTDKERRFLMYPNGWINFFQKAGKDFFCFFCITFLTAAVFGREFDMETHDINRVCSYGGNTLYSMKWCTALSVAILFSIVSYLSEISIATGRYGLKHGSYPLQSISLFEDCPWKVSIMEAAALVLFLKIMGAVLFISLLQFCSLFFRKTVYSVAASVLLAALPFFCISKGSLYHLSVPVSFFLMDGFLGGIYNIETGYYDFLSKKEMAILTGQSFFVITCFAFAGYFFYQGNSYWKYKIIMTGKRQHKKTTMKFLAIFLFPLLIFCQCGKQENTLILYNYQSDLIFENDTEIFITCGNSFIRREKESGREKPLILNLFWEDEDYENTKIIYVAEKDIYYLKYDELNQYDIVRFDLECMEGDVLYRYRISQAEGYNYLGIIPEPGARGYDRKKQQRDKVTGFWADGNYLYLIKDGIVEQFNRHTKKKKTIIKDAESNVSYYDGRIYYLSADYALHCYWIESGKTEVYEEYFLQHFKLLEGKIVFFTLDGQIGYCDNDWKETKIFGKHYGTLIDATEQYFYCQDTAETVTAVNYQGEPKKQYTFSGELAEFASGKKDDWFCGIIREASGELQPVYET